MAEIASRTSRRRGPVPQAQDNHTILLEMGFDSSDIMAALDASHDNLETATLILLGEKNAPQAAEPKQTKPVVVLPRSDQAVAPKAAPQPKVMTKAEITDSHNKFMATYKVKKCVDKSNHDKRICVGWHSRSDRRRNPFEIPYSCSECPNTTEKTVCEDNDACPRAHNMLERMFHPELFKISMCQKGPKGSCCERGIHCAFAHSDEDHRIPLSHTLCKTSYDMNVKVEPIQAGKTLNDSKILNSMQDKLISLIRSQGLDGIISSELPKRFADLFSERLELVDETGEKFRIKDLLLAHPNIYVIMHKGVQPKYIYDEKRSHAPQELIPVGKESASSKEGKSVSASSGAVGCVWVESKVAATLLGKDPAAAAASSLAAVTAAAAAALPPSQSTQPVGVTSPRQLGPATVSASVLSKESTSPSASGMPALITPVMPHEAAPTVAGAWGGAAASQSQTRAQSTPQTQEHTVPVSTAASAAVPDSFHSSFTNSSFANSNSTMMDVGLSFLDGYNNSTSRMNGHGQEDGLYLMYGANSASSSQLGAVGHRWGLDDNTPPAATAAAAGKPIGPQSFRSFDDLNTAYSQATPNPPGLAVGHAHHGVEAADVNQNQNLYSQVQTLQKALHQKSQEYDTQSVLLQQTLSRAAQAEGLTTAVNNNQINLSQWQEMKNELETKNNLLESKHIELAQSKEALRERESALLKAEQTKASLVPELKHLRIKLTAIESDLEDAKVQTMEEHKAKLSLQHQVDSLRSELSVYRSGSVTDKASTKSAVVTPTVTVPVTKNSSEKSSKASKEVSNTNPKELSSVLLELQQTRKSLEAKSSDIESLQQVVANLSRQIAGNTQSSTTKSAGGKHAAAASNSESDDDNSSRDEEEEEEDTAARRPCARAGCLKEGVFICSGCRSTAYCGADHQKEHWKTHKAVCCSP